MAKTVQSNSQNMGNSNPPSDDVSELSSPQGVDTPQEGENLTGEQQNPEEFAKKGPIIPVRFIKKIAIIAFAFLAVIAILVTAYSLYEKWKNRPPPPINVETRMACRNQACVEIEEPGNNECVTDADCLVEVEDKPKFAYIKDRKEIWTANNDGTNKQKKMALIGEREILTALFWKNDHLLSYSKCPALGEKDCVIETLNLNDKSVNSEVTDTKASYIRKHAFSPNGKYFAYIGNETEATSLMFKSGSVNNALEKFLLVEDASNTQSRTFFTPDNQYVVYSTLKKYQTYDETGTRVLEEENVPITYVFQINGVKVEEIKGASDPFLVATDENGEGQNKHVLGYKKNSRLAYRTIGNEAETIITNFADSYNPVISPNKTNIAYWKNEGGFDNVLLGVYDTELRIHRNILRGVILPVWVSDEAVLGVKADGCFGQECLLYEFQTRSLVLANFEKGSNVAIIDHGKTITEITFQENYIGPAEMPTSSATENVEPSEGAMETEKILILEENAIE